MTQLVRDLVSEHEHPGAEGGLGPSSNPAIGPAIPISNNAARERIGALIRITAPSVPINVGAGMKNGSVARTP